MGLSVKVSIPAAGVLLSLLGACGTLITLPAIVKLPNDVVLVGDTKASMTEGSFSVSDLYGTLTCSGTYNPMDSHPTIKVTIKCSDGRTGTAQVTRDKSGLAGAGNAVMSDGTIANVAFGADLTPDRVASPPLQPAGAGHEAPKP